MKFFIQPFLNNLKCSGVIFTRDINNNAPYYKINYDDKSGSSDSITSGKSVSDKVFIFLDTISRENLINFKKLY